MKKIYMAPQAQRIVLETQSILAGSVKIGVNQDAELDAAESYSGSKEWSSDNWDTEE